MPAAQAFVAQNASFYNRKNNGKRPLANASNFDIISLGEIVQNMMDGVILLQRHYLILGEPLMAIIEVGASIILNSQANINKIVTIYTNSNVDILLNGLDKKDILFIK